MLEACQRMSVRALLPFGLGGRKFLVEASFVREILGAVDSVKVPQADRQVPGVFLWNGQAVPLLNLNHCLALGENPASAPVVERTRTVVTEVEGEIVGFGVNKLSEVVKISEDEFTGVRVFKLPFALAEVELKGSVSTVLDLPQLVAHVMHVKSSKNQTP